MKSFLSKSIICILLLLYFTITAMASDKIKFTYYGSGQNSPWTVWKNDFQNAKDAFEEIYFTNKSDSSITAPLLKGRFLTAKNDKFHLNFFVLGKKHPNFKKIVNAIYEAKRTVLIKNKEQFIRFKNSLNKNNISSSALIWFSLVLDGQTWDFFSKDYKLTSHSDEITTSNGLPVGYSGYFWGVEKYYLDRIQMGTNSISEDAFEIKMNWSLPLFDTYPELNRVFWNNGKDLYRHYLNKTVERDTLNDFKKIGLINSEEKLNISIWNENSRYALTAKELSKKIASTVNSFWNNEKIFSLFGDIDSKFAFCIFYHEVMWEILKDLEKEGFLKINPALLGEVNSTSDLKDIILLILK